jgi:PKD repeat protein
MHLNAIFVRPLAAALAAAILLLAAGPAAPAEGARPVKVQATENRHRVDRTHDFELPSDTTHIAVHWQGHRNAAVFVEFSREGTAFSEPGEVGRDEFGAGTEDGRTYGAVLPSPRARVVRVTSDRPLPEVTVLAMNAAAEAAEQYGPGTRVAGANPIPGVISRGDWGADETIRFDQFGEERWLSQYFPLQKLIVHHTAGGNSDPDPASTVRAIYYYHAVTQDWGDIGYQYLIDAAGRIYEGRHSRDYWNGASPSADDGNGMVIAGGHALYHNAGTMGIALMGTFESQWPTPATRTSLVNLMTWAAGAHGIDPTGSSTYVNPVSGVSRYTPNIGGHRDYNSTACPGGVLYSLLPGMRGDVAAGVNDWPGEAFNPSRTVSFAPGGYVGYRFNKAGEITASLPHTLAGPSSASTNQRAAVPTRSGNWYYITSGVFAGYWIAQSPGVTVNGQFPSLNPESYRPWRPLHLAPGTYYGYRFNSWGTVTASSSSTVPIATWVPTTEKSMIPNQGGPWYYVTSGALRGYWIRESGGTSLGTLPTVDFTASATTGLAQLTVAFSNQSITHGAPSWSWDFDNDGTTDSTEPSPTHTYASAGTYSVRLNVTDWAGSGTLTRTNYITVQTPQPGTLIPLTPARVVDTRVGTGLSGPLSANVPRTFQVSGQSGVPAGAVAVTGTLTVTGQTSLGYLYLGPNPTAAPTSSTLNFPLADNRATGMTVALSPGGTLSATYVTGSGSGTTDLVFDVTGYFVVLGP